MACLVPKNTAFEDPETNHQCERRMIIRHFMTKLQVPNLHQMSSTCFSVTTSATVTTSSFELAFSTARVTPLKATKRHGVSHLVSERVTRVANNQTRTRTPIKNNIFTFIIIIKGGGVGVGVCGGRASPSVLTVSKCEYFAPF